MKKYIGIVSSLVGIFSFSSFASAEWVYDSTAQTLTQGTVVLENVSNNNSKLSIGKNQLNTTAVELDFSTGVADGYSITQINQDAFKSNANVTSLVLPDTLTYIGGSAFLGCSNLGGELILPDSLTSTGVHPFMSTAITRIVFGSGMKKVNNWFIRENTALTSIKWNNVITEIGDNAFYKCTGITTFENEFPPNITYIGGSAFHTTPSLEGDNRDIKLLKLTGLGGTAFQNCGIKSVEIGGGLKSTGNAFFQAQKLESVILHEGVTTIGYDCFPFCTSLTNLVMASTITSVGSCMRNMGSAELHIWWKGVPTAGGIDTSSNGILCGKSPAVHHIRLPDKAGWTTFAESLAGGNTSLVLPPAETYTSVGSWGFKGHQKVVWFDIPREFIIMIQ